ncbi:lysoplasmalogenase [Flavihumibacter rivuli]|uniref:lysoplasmalogenase n=1 Tax=Flavihumibacter rivuli TaxID=2838156 RepID=UPI001BDEF4F6|nr:lysoplasmalogenase [Flavihumibacter rivuli]ULQ56189.1 lysoplasmalogenase [Flavihumibacter rivuli]
MKVKGWLYLFGITLVVHLVAIATDSTLVRFITKPLLLAFLMAYFIAANKQSPLLRNWVLLGLFFSWLGDIFLMNEGDKFFLAGLSSFLIAHILYIIFFLRVRKQVSPAKPWNIIVLVALSLYVGIFYFFLAKGLNESMKVPVFVYALTIATMLACSLHAFGRDWNKTALYCGLGAALFVLSDSVLAINQFLTPFKGAGLAIMASYALAQYFIATGTTQWLTTGHKP